MGVAGILRAFFGVPFQFEFSPDRSAEQQLRSATGVCESAS